LDLEWYTIWYALPGIIREFSSQAKFSTMAFKIDDLAKSLISKESVIPAEAGIQLFR
jgi:hypothetical protein